MAVFETDADELKKIVAKAFGDEKLKGLPTKACQNKSARPVRQLVGITNVELNEIPASLLGVEDPDYKRRSAKDLFKAGLYAEHNKRNIDLAFEYYWASANCGYAPALAEISIKICMQEVDGKPRSGKSDVAKAVACINLAEKIDSLNIDVKAARLVINSSFAPSVRDLYENVNVFDSGSASSALVEKIRREEVKCNAGEFLLTSFEKRLLLTIFVILPLISWVVRNLTA